MNVCDRLSEDTNYVRVDLYNVDGKIYFGELTFFPGGGFTPFVPDIWNDIIGDYLNITLQNER